MADVSTIDHLKWDKGHDSLSVHGSIEKTFPYSIFYNFDPICIPGHLGANHTNCFIRID